MNIEQELKNIQKVYLKTEPSKKFIEQGWQDLQGKIEHMGKIKYRSAFSYLRPVAFAVLAIFILAGSFTGLTQASQKALPGEPLYPIKRLSENLISAASGNNLAKVDNRAQEIVDLTKKGKEGQEQLKQTVEEYKEEVSEAGKSGKNVEDFEEQLEEHERKFEEIREDRSGSNSGKEIDEAIEISKSGRGRGGDRQEEEDHSGSDSGKD